MSLEQKKTAFNGAIVALLFVIAFLVGQASGPSLALADTNSETNQDIGGSVTTSTTAASVSVPGGRGKSLTVNSPSSNTTNIYIKLAEVDGVTSASSSNFTWILSPGQTVSFNQHNFASFSYAAASATPTLNYAILHR